MRAVSPLVLPDSRALTGWWPQVASLSPRTLWVGRLLLHHVEALVRTTHLAPLDRLSALLLRALAQAPASLSELESRLALDRQFLTRLLLPLASAGLVEQQADAHWLLTPKGRTASATGQMWHHGRERRAFHFRDGQPPHFLRLVDPPCLPMVPPPDWSFDAALLQACADRPDEWKRQHGFPSDVEGVVTSRTDDIRVPAWKHVILDSAEELPVLLAVIPGGDNGVGERLVGFVIHPQVGLVAESVFSLGPGWPEVFPEVEAGQKPEAWWDSWRRWCRTHQVADEDGKSVEIHASDTIVRMRGSASLIENLRPATETWLLAGEGDLRQAARLEMVVI
jgi:DNA-binding MarR family transcriptional regulator